MKKTGLRIFVLVGVFGVLPGAATAQLIPKTINFKAGWADNRATRRTQALEWLREMSEIDNQIPTLSPTEAAWLKVEYDDELARNGGSYTPRASRASASKEFATRSAKPQAALLVAILNELSSPAPITERREVRLWAELTSRVLFVNFWGDISTLGDAGIIARDPKAKPVGGYQNALYGTWAARAEQIVGEIVVPYLDRTGR